MKNLIVSCLVFAFASTVQSAGAAEDLTKEVTIALNDAFVPETVERGTDAKVVLTGIYPNSCYRWARADVRTPFQSTIEIKARATVTVNTMCLMVLVPFSKEVNLGRLPAGVHTLRFTSGDDTYFERKLTVQ